MHAGAVEEGKRIVFLHMARGREVEGGEELMIRTSRRSKTASFVLACSTTASAPFGLGMCRLRVRVRCNRAVLSLCLGRATYDVVQLK